MSYHKVVGYFSAASKTELFCDGDSLIVAGTEELMKDYIVKCNKDDFTKDYRYPVSARKFFDNWKAQLRWQKLKSFEKFAAMIKKHWDGYERKGFGKIEF